MWAFLRDDVLDTEELFKGAEKDGTFLKFQWRAVWRGCIYILRTALKAWLPDPALLVEE